MSSGLAFCIREVMPQGRGNGELEVERTADSLAVEVRGSLPEGHGELGNYLGNLILSESHRPRVLAAPHVYARVDRRNWVCGSTSRVWGPDRVACRCRIRAPECHDSPCP